jgi:hypothetical protein
MKCIDDIAELCYKASFPGEIDTDVSNSHLAISNAINEFKNGNITADTAIADIS